MNPSNTAPLRNVILFNELIDRLMNRAPHLPGMATFHGFSGYGKTKSAVYGANEHKAAYVEAGYSWSQSKFCDAVLMELGHPAKGTIAVKVDKIIEVLATEGRPLIIDEFDFIVSRRFVDLIREIHDKSGAPIIMIGEELLPNKLSEWERFHNRVLDFVAAQPADIDDIAQLARMYCPDIRIESDLLEAICKKSEGRIRRACVNFEAIRNVAQLRGINSVGIAHVDERALFTGKAPQRRAA